jgi:hypothetical protein
MKYAILQTKSHRSHSFNLTTLQHMLFMKTLLQKRLNFPFTLIAQSSEHNKHDSGSDEAGGLLRGCDSPAFIYAPGAEG